MTLFMIRNLLNPPVNVGGKPSFLESGCIEFLEGAMVECVFKMLEREGVLEDFGVYIKY